MWSSTITGLRENPVPNEIQWVVVDYTDGTTAFRKTYKFAPGNEAGIEAAVQAEVDALNTISAAGHANGTSTAAAAAAV
jgi:hypothetical protein